MDNKENIEKENQIWFCHCMECDYEWESEKEAFIKCCPKCNCGDIHITDEEGNEIENECE